MTIQLTPEEVGEYTEKLQTWYARKLDRMMRAGLRSGYMSPIDAAKQAGDDYEKQNPKPKLLPSV